MDEVDAHQRMAAQSSQAEKVAKADRVIENDGTVEELHGRLDTYWLNRCWNARAECLGD
jgi:dephospho-CoA kinase